jgi:hypothetical protein
VWRLPRLDNLDYVQSFFDKVFRNLKGLLAGKPGTSSTLILSRFSRTFK